MKKLIFFLLAVALIAAAILYAPLLNLAILILIILYVVYFYKIDDVPGFDASGKTIKTPKFKNYVSAN